MRKRKKDGGRKEEEEEKKRQMKMKKMMMMGCYLAGGVVVVVGGELLLLQNAAVLAEELEIARRSVDDDGRAVSFRARSCRQNERKVQMALLETEAARGHFGQTSTVLPTVAGRRLLRQQSGEI